VLNGLIIFKYVELASSTGNSVLFCIIGFIISMTKLLDADWLRGVQLFH
jgi:hypothetical protein